jgi:hypothetical protein
MRLSTLSAVGAIAIVAGSASAALVTPGNVLVYRVGDRSAVLANTGNAVFVDEYTPSGTLVQSIAMPSTGTGAKLVASGTASSEGLMTVSPDGRWLTLTGYNSTIPAGSNLTSSTSASVNRTVAIVDLTSATNAATYTLLSDASTGSSIRSAVTNDGTNIWLAGGAGGVRYTTVGSTTSIGMTTLANVRQVNIYNGQLYASDQSTGGGNTASLGTVGTGLPTTTGQTFTSLPGFPALGGSPATNNYAYFLADLSSTVTGVDTLYVADEGALALTKYSLVSGSWIANGTIGVDADDYRGIHGGVRADGSVQLFATRKGASSATGGGDLVSLLDSSGYNGTFTGAPTVIASATSSSTAGSFNTAFRGVVYVVPTPGSAALLGLGGLFALRRKR